MTRYTRYIVMLFLLSGTLACSTARDQVAGNQETEEQSREEVSEKEQLESTALLIEAIQQKLLGNMSRATSLFHEATQKDPRNDAAWFELSKLHARSGDLANAYKYANTASEIDPDNQEYHLLVADICILKDDMPKAVGVYEQLAKNNPENIELQKTLISAYLHNDQYDEAISVIEHIETTTGFSKEISIQKLRILVSQEKYHEAIKEAEKMIRFYPEEMLFYELLGDMYLETGQDEKAKNTFMQMLEVDPDSHMARLLLADYYHQQNEPEKAYEQLVVAFRNPALDIEGKGRILYSYLYWSEEDPQYLHQALKLSELLIATHHDDPEAYLIRGDLLQKNDQKEEARDMYLKGAVLDPSGLTVWQQILSIDLQLGDYDKMLTHSDMALEYFFEQPILFLFNGLANMQLKDYESAASSLEYGLMIAVEDEDLRQDFLTMLGDTYYYLDAHEESDRYYEKALEKNPDNATALNNYSYHLALRKERLDEARSMSERSLEIDPGNAAFLDTYGWIKYQMKDYGAAKQWINKAMEASEDPSAAILEHYGDVLYQLGQKEKALRYWKKAKEAGNGSEFLNKKIEDQTLYE